MARLVVLLSLLALARAQWCECENAPTDCTNSTQNFNIDERFDCGPYVPRFRCSDAATNDGCGGGGLSLTVPIDNDDPAEVRPPDPSLSSQELDDYKTLELEFLSDILKNDPLFPDEGETKLDLPYCGMLWDSPGSRRRDVPVYGSSVYKRGWGSVFKGIKWPTLSSGPKRPTFPRKPTPPNVRVVFNVFATNYTSQDKITDAVLDQAVAELNAAYNIRMRISFFRDQSVHRFTDPWDADHRRFTQHVRGDLPANYMMRQEFRHGGKDVLHVFILESIRRGDNRLNGFCYFPDSSIDGCAVAYDTLTGVSHQDCDTTSRGTLTHEVGHWLGLKHTHDESDDDECRGDNDIAVIPQFPFANRFCDTQQPCSTGRNPSIQTGTNVRMTNFMSYAFRRGTPYVKDVGPWVAEQQAKAWTNFHTFRAPSARAKRAALLGTQRGPSLYTRILRHRARQNSTLAARGILASRPHIREELLAICKTPWSEDDKSIDDNIPDKDNDSSIIPDPREDPSTPGGKDKGGGSGTDKGSGKGKSGGSGKGNGGGGSGSGSGSGGGDGDGGDGDGGGDGGGSGALVARPASLLTLAVTVLLYLCVI